MAKKIKLAEAEWDIMEGVWNHGGQVTVREVQDALYPKAEKAYTTTQTIMNILVTKGFLKRKKIGMVNFYVPKVSRALAAQHEARTLVSRIFNGSMGALATYLVDSGELTPEELQRLKDLIAAKEQEQQSGGA
ncbi:MAG: BlaI/MecI/CopY family transcriptional regulator [candidate division KSB1 bacterium]